MKNSKLYNNLINGISNSVKQSLNEGSWGYDPQDSDSALDLRDIILDKVLDVIYDTCKKQLDKGKCHPYNVVGVIQYFMENLTKGYNNKDAKRFVKLYDKCIEMCKNDTAWISSWRQPEVLKYQLEREQPNKLFTAIRNNSIDGNNYEG